MSNELATIGAPVFDLGENNSSNAYCSMSLDTDDDRAAFYNAVSDPDEQIANVVNTVINVRDVYCETVNVTNKDTGETSVAPRVVLVDTEGKSYQSVSTGIFNAIRRLMQVFGPPTWEKGLPLKVVQKNIGKNRLYTLVCVK